MVPDNQDEEVVVGEYDNLPRTSLTGDKLRNWERNNQYYCLMKIEDLF